MYDLVPECLSPCRILIVDDEAAILEMLSKYLSHLRCAVDVTSDSTIALERISTISYDIMILDLKMPGMDGISVLREAKKIDPDISVIIMTAFGTVNTAVEAMKLGADEYLLKPLQLEALGMVLRRLLEYRELRGECVSLREQLESVNPKGDLIARSRKMLDITRLIEKIAPLPSTVLVQGESGTGKELIARAIHQASPRSRQRFVAINCGVIPINLLESELFGYEKGAFTGADSRKLGYFEAACGGTLLLDEIGEMPMELQVKLLRVVQEKRFQRLGGTQEIATDVRIIASTNRNLEEDVRKGIFRKDLFYRLNVITINVPPLRERPEDIPVLAFHFMHTYAADFHKAVKSISPSVMDLLLRWRWEGNVRELENIIERAVAVAEDDEIATRDIPPAIRDFVRIAGPVPLGDLKPFAAAKEEFEREYLQALLRTTEGNIAKASRLASIPRPNLYEKLKKHGIQKAHAGVGVIEQLQPDDAFI